MTATCELCGEKVELIIPRYGRRFYFCHDCANDLKPLTWNDSEWSDFINWLDSPPMMYATDDPCCI